MKKMESLSKTIRQSTNRNSKQLLLITICFLTIWGLWVFSDSFGLFRRYQFMSGSFWYSSLFFKQFFAISLGLITFIIVIKFNFEKKIKYPFIWLIIPVIVLFFTMYDYSSRDLHFYIFNFSLRSGLFVTICSVFFFVFSINNEKSFSTREVIGLLIYICIINILLSTFDLITALMFTLASIVFLYFYIGKKLSLSILFFNTLVSSFLLLFNSYARNRTFVTYFGDEHFFQVKQSIMCILAGLFWGYGPAGSYISSNYYSNVGSIEAQLPIALPDFGEGFMFSVVGFQYGLPGIIILILAFLTIIFLGIKATKQARSKSSAFLVLTSTIIFSLSLFIGMATPLGLIPPNSEGIFLFSYGGTTKMIFSFYTFALIYKNLDVEGNSPNHLSINSKYLHAFIFSDSFKSNLSLDKMESSSFFLNKLGLKKTKFLNLFLL